MPLHEPGSSCDDCFVDVLHGLADWGLHGGLCDRPRREFLTCAQRSDRSNIEVSKFRIVVRKEFKH